MPTHARVYSKDEELGKRDDDFRPRRTPTSSTLLQPWRWRKRRFAAALIVLFLIYVFVKNIPTDLGTWDERVPPEYRPRTVQEWRQRAQPGGMQQPSGKPPVSTKGEPPRQGGGGEVNDEHYFAGPIKFYNLRETLTGIARTSGSRPTNRNIMFGASGLRNAANLLPMACEMARWDRNYVHFVLMGRDSLPVKDVLDVNGINPDECRLYFHDARPDWSEYSTDARAEVSVAGAMKHINEYMHPQAIITDDSLVEDDFFIRAIRRKAKEYGRPAIEIPAGRYEDFLWIAMLDSGSLSNWFRPSIDILVQAPQGSSGSLIRLLKSLESADYDGLKPPRLIIELPSKVEPFAQRYLEGFVWPPSAQLSPIQQSTLVMRHRIPSNRLTSEQASMRFVEGFYPINPRDNHVLVLSPQAELSPLFWQYLHYVLLEHKYSSYASYQSDDLLGISLDVPTTFLNGSGKFVLPKVRDMRAPKYLDEQKIDKMEETSFLYQAPSSTAGLILGDKWATLHDFLANRLTASHAGNVKKTPKLVSETEPAWVEFLLELMRSRGWSMLHPAKSFVTIHNDLAQVPEEFIKGKPPRQEDDYNGHSDHSDEEPFLTADSTPQLRSHLEAETPSGKLPLHQTLQFDGDLPELAHLPYLSHAGELVPNISVLLDMADAYVPNFRMNSGGCDEKSGKLAREPKYLITEDLFCLPGMEFDTGTISIADDENDEEVAQAIVEASALPVDFAASAMATMKASKTLTSKTESSTEYSDFRTLANTVGTEPTKL